MTISRNITWGAVTLAVLGAAYAAWHLGQSRPGAPAASPPAHDHAAMSAAPSGNAQPVRLTDEAMRRIGVTYAVASSEVVRHEVRAAGEVAVDEGAVQSVVVRVDGWLDRVFVTSAGARVTAGDTLALLASPALIAAQEELLLAVRLGRTLADNSAERRADADDLVRSARRRLATLGVPVDDVAALERSGAVQRDWAIRAPASGVVLDKAATSGQAVSPGQSLFRIADLSTVWLEAEVFEQDLPAVRIGMSVEAELRALPGAMQVGRVTFVSPTLDPDTRTARIRVALRNPAGALKPGMFATVRFAAPSAPGIVSVPRTAVFTTGERSLVFVKRSDGMLEPRPVTLGIASETRSQVLTGLALGDTVVASATFLVDAESNLNTALGGMGDMPGMDMTKPAARPTPPARRRE